jgi:AraC family transcriptional activator of pobA
VYIEAAMMAEARRLLAFTRLQVSEVGYRLGFSDPSYFSKRFKAKEGLTPLAYKARFAPEV